MTGLVHPPDDWTLRNQKGKVGWDRMRRIAGYYLPPVKTRHPWPEVRFAARYS
ncbi:MAG TPA: hypothetical protein VHZ03_06310 [Trebonia sp.]|jgi:hypothetical protein|nr:hypothetical protein [Trebonia sp.]